jgi:mannose-6-phosphate isomerase-like protein (cupin superfamily)
MDASEQGIVVGPGEARELLAGRWWLPLQAADTPGGLSMMEALVPVGTRPTRPHRHRRTDEVWYILAGELTFRLGAREVVAGPGTTVIVPRGVIHQLQNAGDEAVRYLVLHLPGEQEGYFAELGALMMATPGGPPNRAQWDQIAARYDTEFCDLPPRAD